MKPPFNSLKPRQLKDTTRNSLESAIMEALIKRFGNENIATVGYLFAILSNPFN